MSATHCPGCGAQTNYPVGEPCPGCDGHLLVADVPLSRDQQIARLCTLLTLQKELRFVDYAKLGLRHFDDLREEVEQEIAKVRSGGA